MVHFIAWVDLKYPFVVYIEPFENLDVSAYSEQNPHKWACEEEHINATA